MKPERWLRSKNEEEKKPPPRTYLIPADRWESGRPADKEGWQQGGSGCSLGRVTICKEEKKPSSEWGMAKGFKRKERSKKRGGGEKIIRYLWH